MTADEITTLQAGLSRAGRERVTAAMYAALGYWKNMRVTSVAMPETPSSGQLGADKLAAAVLVAQELALIAEYTQ